MWKNVVFIKRHWKTKGKIQFKTLFFIRAEIHWDYLDFLFFYFTFTLLSFVIFVRFNGCIYGISLSLVAHQLYAAFTLINMDDVKVILQQKKKRKK